MKKEQEAGNMKARTLGFFVAAFFSSVVYGQEYHRVLLVSFDGVGAETFETNPTLGELFHDGYYTRAYTTVPCVTLPAHASLLTGVDVRDRDAVTGSVASFGDDGPNVRYGHGIGWNSFNPEFGAVAVTTIFEVFKRHGWTTTAVVGKVKLRHVLPPRALDSIAIAPDPRVAFALASQALQQDHSFVFLHIPGPDTAGHSDGWGSLDYARAVTESSLGLKDLLQNLRVPGSMSTTPPRDLLVVLTADHGGKGKSHPTTCGSCYAIPFAIHGNGIMTMWHPTYSDTAIWDIPATILNLVHLPVPATWLGKPVEVRAPDAAHDFAPEARDPWHGEQNGEPSE